MYEPAIYRVPVCVCTFVYVCLHETEGKCVLERQGDFMKTRQ